MYSSLSFVRQSTQSGFYVRNIDIPDMFFSASGSLRIRSDVNLPNMIFDITLNIDNFIPGYDTGRDDVFFSGSVLTFNRSPATFNPRISFHPFLIYDVYLRPSAGIITNYSFLDANNFESIDGKNWNLIGNHATYSHRTSFRYDGGFGISGYIYIDADIYYDFSLTETSDHPHKLDSKEITVSSPDKILDYWNPTLEVDDYQFSIDQEATVW